MISTYLSSQNINPDTPVKSFHHLVDHEHTDHDDFRPTNTSVHKLTSHLKRCDRKGSQSSLLADFFQVLCFIVLDSLRTFGEGMSQKFRDPKKPPGSKKFDPWSSCTAPVQHTAATWLSPAATSQAKMGKVTWLRTAFRSWLSVNLVAYTSLLGGHRSPNECLLYQWWVDRRQFQMNMICFYPQQGVWRSTWSYSKNPIKRKYKFGMGMIQFQILNTNISPSKLPPQPFSSTLQGLR